MHMPAKLLLRNIAFVFASTGLTTNLVGASGIATFCRSTHEIRKSLVAFANDTNDTDYSTNYLRTMANVPFGEMLESCGSVQASFPAFSAAIGAEEPHQWTVVSLKDLKGDIEVVTKNPVNAKLIQSTAGKHVYALRTWLENMESRDQ
jgi:hypothetical protein